MHTDYSELQNKLIDAFIAYQWRLDHPFPQFNENKDTLDQHYLCNPIFKAKVDMLVAGTTHIVRQWVESADGT